jgi:hypothetical protein
VYKSAQNTGIFINVFWDCFQFLVWKKDLMWRKNKNYFGVLNSFAFLNIC